MTKTTPKSSLVAALRQTLCIAGFFMLAYTTQAQSANSNNQSTIKSITKQELKASKTNTDTEKELPKKEAADGYELIIFPMAQQTCPTVKGAKTKETATAVDRDTRLTTKL